MNDYGYLFDSLKGEVFSDIFKNFFSACYTSEENVDYFIEHYVEDPDMDLIISMMTVFKHSDLFPEKYQMIYALLEYGYSTILENPRLFPDEYRHLANLFKIGVN